jgi:hypothetical protein
MSDTDGRWSIHVDMDDVPHLTEKEKAKILRGVPPWQLQARKSGIPGHGIGAIYPIPESVMIIPPFDIPRHWPRSYALDPGWNVTAALWVAWNIDRPYTDYQGNKRHPGVAYAEYYRGQEHPAIHAAAIRSHGAWIPGLIDPAAEKARGPDGELLIDVYRNLGLNVSKADNTVVSGLVTTWDMLSTGKLQIFDTLTNWRKEFRLYRRDEKGVIIKKNDHLMDCTRYQCMSGFVAARPPPAGEGGVPWFTWSPELATPGGVWSG